MERILFFVLAFWSIPLADGIAQQDTLRALFLGNSYTNGNNLPQLTSNISAGKNKVLITDKVTPGGHTLNLHSSNSTSLSKIRQGGWDFVVLQEQSQIPTIDFYRYNSMYPAAMRLEDSIRKYNPCANIVMFMTWGRRFGGQQCDGTMTHCSPVFVDFAHMQDSLESAYVEIGQLIDAYIAPVGMAWKKSILDTSFVLHTSDNSHPNARGSYLAACVFHQVFWNESAVGTSFNHTLSSSDALFFQTTADSVVQDTTKDWNLDINRVFADFYTLSSGDTVLFMNQSQSRQPVSYFWDFGDGDTSSLESPFHIFSHPGTYNVKLIVTHCSNKDSVSYPVQITSIDERTTNFDLNLSPNPNHGRFVVNSGKVMVSEMIYDPKGRLLGEFSKQGSQLEFNIHNYPSGLYLLRVNFEDGSSAVWRFIKKKN